MFPKHALLSIYAFVRVHFGCSKNSTAFTLQVVDTFFSQKPLCFDWWLFPKKSWSLFLFESVLAFLVNQFYFLFCFFFHEAFYYLNICIFLWGILLPYIFKVFLLPCIFKVFLLPKHIHILCEASLLPKHIHTYSKHFCYLNIYIYIFFVRYYYLPSLCLFI